MKITLFPLPFQFSLYILGLIIIGLDVFTILMDRQGGGILIVSRLCAAIFGFLYMKSYQSGNDFLGKLIPTNQTILKIKQLFQKKTNPYMNVKRGKKETNTHRRPKSDEEFNIEKIKKQKQVDAILDKISQKGYENLTKEEKEILFNNSK